MVAQCCPELRRLEVAGCYNISNEAVFEVVSRCPSLEHLNLSGKKKIDIVLLPAIRRVNRDWLFPHITHVDLP